MILARSRQANGAPQKSPTVASKPVAARTTSSGSGDDTNGWMITLSDLTLLLLGFLAVWYTTEKKMQPAQPAPVVVRSTATKPSAPVTRMDDSAKIKEWKALQNEMERLIADTGLAKDVSVESTQADLVVSLRDTVPFASGKAELRAQALPVLEKVVSLVRSRPLLFLEISGHTDDIPIATGVFPSNWELSAARASRVARYLIEKGIDPSRIAVQGYANQRPKAPDSNARNRRANRRVEIRLSYGTDGDQTR
jgi:chemotaxis protein MotB